MKNKDELLEIISFAILVIIVGIALLVLSTRVNAERNSGHIEEATVISIQRLNNQIVRFETEDNNLWEVEFSLDEPIDIGDKATLIFQDNDTSTRKDDEVINVTFIEE